MSIHEKIASSVTTITKAVIPNTTNHYNTLYGGTAMQWMDETAFITATRFCRQKFVTVSVDRIDFKTPIPAGTLIELRGCVESIGKTSLKVKVNVFLEQMHEDTRDKAIEGIFTFVAIDENMKPEKIMV